jgi:hypothetical protein
MMNANTHFGRIGLATLLATTLLAGCGRREEGPNDTDSTSTASTQGRDAANVPAGVPGGNSGAPGTGSAGTGSPDSTLTGTGSAGAMGGTQSGTQGGNPNGQGTGDSSTRSNVQAGAAPDSTASSTAGFGANRSSTNSR